jgi:hypothetical protein
MELAQPDGRVGGVKGHAPDCTALARKGKAGARRGLSPPPAHSQKPSPRVPVAPPAATGHGEGAGEGELEGIRWRRLGRGRENLRRTVVSETIRRCQDQIQTPTGWSRCLDFHCIGTDRFRCGIKIFCVARRYGPKNI